jgi:hypothetical protein
MKCKRSAPKFKIDLSDSESEENPAQGVYLVKIEIPPKLYSLPIITQSPPPQQQCLNRPNAEDECVTAGPVDEIVPLGHFMSRTLLSKYQYDDQKIRMSLQSCLVKSTDNYGYRI